MHFPAYAKLQTFTEEDNLLPPALWQAPIPKLKSIHIRGRADAFALLESLPDSGLAIVGTRAPLPRNLNLVRRSVRALADSNLIIVSGLARGIDASAHEAALDEGLPTIGVLACGLDEVYPRSHERLAERILDAGGLLVSEYPFQTQAYPNQFLARNRIIAAWTRATWMVEAAARSGALNTASHAVQFGKDLYVTPSFPGDAALLGNLSLLDQGIGHAYWGPHSLGASWLELSSSGKTAPTLPARALTPHEHDDAAHLTRWVTRRQSRGGGITRPELQDQLMDEGWEPGRFHLAVEAACARGWLADELGMIYRPAAI